MNLIQFVKQNQEMGKSQWEEKFPDWKNIVIKNISDSNSLKEIEKHAIPISTTISWWSLIADTNNLEFDDLGWKVDPPLGSQENREFLIKGLENDLIQAIAFSNFEIVYFFSEK